MATGIKKVAGLFSGTSLNESYTLFERLDLAQSNTSFSVASQDSDPTGLTFNNDGTKMYIVGRSSDDVYQYDLSTAFDISTASYNSAKFVAFSFDRTPTGLVFNNDGTKMYIVESDINQVHQYSLSTAFNISTASDDNVPYTPSIDTNLTALAFNNDGTKMYILGDATNAVYQYSLSTAFNISTASYDSVSFSVIAEEALPKGLVFNNDGTKMYIVGESGERVYQYNVNIAYDISTASYSNVSIDVSAEDGKPQAVSFNNDGTKMYIIGAISTSVHEYTTTVQSVESEVLYTAPSDKCAKITADLYSSSVSGTYVYIGGVLKVSDFDKLQFQEPYHVMTNGRVRFYQTNQEVNDSSKLDYFFLGPNETFEIRAPIGVTTVSYELRIIEDNAG